MLLLQRHFGMLPEGLARGRVLVLRADGEHDAALPADRGRSSGWRRRLRPSRPLPERDAVEPVVADDAAPERVVEIEDENLARLAHERADDAGDHVGVDRGELRREGKLRRVPVARIVPALVADRGREARDVGDDDSAASRPFPQLAR